MNYVQEIEKVKKELKSVLINLQSKFTVEEIIYSDDVLGVLSNFVVEDGCLKADEPEGLELKGMGFSPVFEFDLLEYDSYFKPVNGVMTEIGFTKTPRSQIVYNSIGASNGDDNMSDDALRRVLQEKEDLVKKNMLELEELKH